MRTKISLVNFFKYSVLAHFWGLRLIACIDMIVVVTIYSFQSITQSFERVFEKIDKKTNNIQIINSQMLQFFSVKRLNYVSNGNWLSSFTQGNSQSPTDHSKLKCIKWELQRTVSDATKKGEARWSPFSGQIYWGVLSCLHAKRLGKWGEYW